MLRLSFRLQIKLVLLGTDSIRIDNAEKPASGEDHPAKVCDEIVRLAR
jgi:hypothetical protein